MSVYVPKGYIALNDWIAAEVSRRGYVGDPGNVPNDIYWPVFEDLANYLGQHDTVMPPLAKCVTERGIEDPVPIEEWRKAPKARDELSSGWVHLHAGFFNEPIPARIYIRSDLRIEQPAPGSSPPLAKVGTAVAPRRRGRHPKYDWAAFHKEIARRVGNDPDGYPIVQAELERDMTQWCMDEWGEDNCPSESTIREHVASHYR